MIETKQTRRVLCLAVLAALLATMAMGGSQEKSQSVTGILGAFGEEGKIIKEAMSGKEIHQVMGIEFVSGRLEGRRVVLALTGVGKVNAAMTTTLLLDHFRPTEVIFTGIAGGLNPKLLPGDIVIAEKLAQHDYGTVTEQGFQKRSARNPIDGKRNPLFLPCDGRLVKLATGAAANTKFAAITIDGKAREPNIVEGIVVTGDVFVASREKVSSLIKEFGADAVDMEGAAVAQVCFQQKVPFLVVRSLSDKADDTAQVDVQQFYKIAAKNSASLVITLVGELAKKDAVVKD